MRSIVLCVVVAMLSISGRALDVREEPVATDGLDCEDNQRLLTTSDG